MFADLRCSPSCARAGVHGTVAICPPDWWCVCECDVLCMFCVCECFVLLK